MRILTKDFRLIVQIFKSKDEDGGELIGFEFVHTKDKTITVVHGHSIFYSDTHCFADAERDTNVHTPFWSAISLKCFARSFDFSSSSFHISDIVNGVRLAFPE